MTPFEVYKTYLALKMHFTKDSYDYIKYSGSVSAKEETFQKRKDKYFFTKASKHKDPFNLILSNMVKNPKVWVGSLTDKDCIAVYESWKKRVESITYMTLIEMVENFDSNFVSNFVIKNNQHPNILKLYISEKISLETLIISLDITRTLVYFDEKLSDDVIWQSLSTLIKKYKPFIDFDGSKIKKEIIAKNHFDNIPFD